MSRRSLSGRTWTQTQTILGYFNLRFWGSWPPCWDGFPLPCWTGTEPTVVCVRPLGNLSGGWGLAFPNKCEVWEGKRKTASESWAISPATLARRTLSLEDTWLSLGHLVSHGDTSTALGPRTPPSGRFGEGISLLDSLPHTLPLPQLRSHHFQPLGTTFLIEPAVPSTRQLPLGLGPARLFPDSSAAAGGGEKRKACVAAPRGQGCAALPGREEPWERRYLGRSSLSL